MTKYNIHSQRKPYVRGWPQQISFRTPLSFSLRQSISYSSSVMRALCSTYVSSVQPLQSTDYFHVRVLQAHQPHCFACQIHTLLYRQRALGATINCRKEMRGPLQSSAQEPLRTPQRFWNHCKETQRSVVASGESSAARIANRGLLIETPLKVSGSPEHPTRSVFLPPTSESSHGA